MLREASLWLKRWREGTAMYTSVIENNYDDD